MPPRVFRDGSVGARGRPHELPPRAGTYRLRGVTETVLRALGATLGRAIGYGIPGPLSERELLQMPGRMAPDLDTYVDLAPWAYELAGYFARRAGPQALAANAAFRFVVVNNMGGDFLVSRITHQATGLYSVNMSLSSGRQLTQGAVVAQTIFGDGDDPSRLPYPIIVPGNSDLILEVADLSAAPNTIEINVHGARLWVNTAAGDIAEARAPYIPYFIPVDGADGIVLAGSGVGTSTVQLDGEGDFQLVGLAHQATSNAFRFRLQSNTEGEALMDAELDARASSSATVGRQHWLAVRPLLPRRVQLAVTFTDLSAAPNTVRMTLLGIKWLVGPVHPAA